MTVEPNAQVTEEQTQTQQVSDKEYNFAQIRQQLERERKARIEAEQRAQEAEKIVKQRTIPDDEDDDDEPYVDRKKLEKKLNKFGQQTKQETESIVQQEVRKAIEEERKNSWLKNNPDFYEVMNHAQKFAEKDPELAESILAMPDGFERQKLVYKNIKALGIHKKEEPKSNIQDTVNNNRRNPYYQPSDMTSPPYGMVTGGKTYTPSEQKNAYDKMKELQRQLRL